MIDLNQFLNDLEAQGLTIVPKKKKSKKKLKKEEKELKKTAKELQAMINQVAGDTDESFSENIVSNNVTEDQPQPTRAIWNPTCNTIETLFDLGYDPDKKSYLIRQHHYNPETGKSTSDERVFVEGDVVWIGLNRGSEFGCNLDTDQPGSTGFFPIYLPADPTAFFDLDRYDEFGKYRAPGLADENDERREPFPAERDLIYALEQATKYQSPGFFIFCRGGRFGVLCHGHYDFTENDFDNLICVFNAKRCREGYRKTWLEVFGEADSEHLVADLRYSPMEHWFWPENIIEELVDEAVAEKTGRWPEDYDE